MSNPRLSPAEQKVRKLARLPGNCTCPNCGLEKPKFGFSNVCVKFLTFVCNNCKSSHQAISHRCKSLTMSSWTNDEVESLEECHGGGNDVCRNTWLHRAPPPGTQGRPKPDSDISVYKQFVVDVYERRKYYYYGESTTTTTKGPAAPEEEESTTTTSPGAPPPSFAKAPPVVVATHVNRAPKVSAPRTKIAPVLTATAKLAQPVTAPPTTADLLDFFSEPTTTTTTTTSAATASTFTADFTNFSTPSTSLASNAAAPVAATADLFGDFLPTSVVPTTTPVSSSAMSSSATSWIRPPPPPVLTSTSLAPMTTMNSQSATISTMMAPTGMMMMTNHHSTTTQNGNLNGMYSNNGNTNATMMVPNIMTSGNGNGMTMNNTMAMNSGMMMNYGRNDVNWMNNGNNNNAMNSSGVVVGGTTMNNDGMNNYGMNGMNDGFAMTTMNGGNNMNGMNGGFAMNNNNSNMAGRNNGFATDHRMVMNPHPPVVGHNNPMAFQQNGQEPKKSDPFADLKPFQS